MRSTHTFTCVNAVFFADIYFSKCSLSTHHPFRVFITWIVILILNSGSSSNSFFSSSSFLDLENEARSRLLCCCWSWLSLYCVQGNDLNLHSKLFKNGVQNKCAMYTRVHIKKTRVLQQRQQQSLFQNDGIFARRLPINFIVIGVIALIVG